ncbi:MAG: tetratricopeptide repeat protein, partial [Lentisphaeraceae bacterium]|nr:tetratricopeptide repeat protein [Lentisphaeraceae bacterium]
MKTANELFDAGYSTDALPYAEQALEFSIREFGEMSAETGKVSSRLAFIYYEKRMFGSARKEYSRLIRILNTLPGARKTELIEAYKKLASIAIAFEEIATAEELYELLLNLQKMFQGDSHEEALASSIMLARINAYQKDYENLYKYVDETVNMLEKNHGENCQEIADHLKIKLQFQNKEKNFNGELQTIRKLYAVAVKQTGENSVHSAEKLNMEADCLIRLEKFSEAEKVCIKALEICRTEMSHENPKLISTCRRLALIYSNLQKPEDAEALLIEAKEYAAKNKLNEDLHEEILKMLCAQ